MPPRRSSTRRRDGSQSRVRRGKRAANRQRRSKGRGSNRGGLRRRRQRRTRRPKIDYNSGQGMRTSAWGPVFWTTLGFVASGYPPKPTADQRETYQQFFDAFFKVLPCRACRENSVDNLVSSGYGPSVFRTRASLTRFVCDMHNAVNEMLGKDVHWTYKQFRDFYESLRARCVKGKDIGDKARSHGGCYGDIGQHDPRVTTIIRMLPEAEANEYKAVNHCDSLALDAKCRRV